MALASWPTRQGQQRSLRSIGQALSWAFARSPEARSFACALFASTCLTQRQGDAAETATKFACRLQFG
jgi:hypothetical protein